jgi:DamX protein
MFKQSFVKFTCGGVLTLFVLVGCAHKPQAKAPVTYGSFANTKACKDTPFLQKYGCSLDKIEKAAEQSDPDAQYALGYMYYYGIGTVRDQQTAKLWIERSADQGQSLAIKAIKLIDHTDYPKMGGVSIQKGAKNYSALGVVKTASKMAPKHAVQGHKTAKMVALKSGVGSNVKKVQVPALKHDQSIKVLKAIRHHYTLQLMASHDLKLVKQFIARSPLHKKMSYYRTKFQNKAWYVVIYGDYQSAAAARMALNQLPKLLRARHPWVKSFARVQKEILTHSIAV